MEIWKDLNAFYEVSDLGQVRSKSRFVRSTWGGSYLKDGRVLRQTDNGNGYLQVSLCYDGVTKMERVHRLVALVFVENPLGLPKVNHKDNNRRNNAAINLEWCTQSENIKHAQMQGRMQHQGGVLAKLDYGTVYEIKRKMVLGATNKELSKAFNVHPGTINCIRTGRNWANVPFSGLD